MYDVWFWLTKQTERAACFIAPPPIKWRMRFIYRYSIWRALGTGIIFAEKQLNNTHAISIDSWRAFDCSFLSYVYMYVKYVHDSVGWVAVHVKWMCVCVCVCEEKNTYSFFQLSLLHKSNNQFQLFFPFFISIGAGTLLWYELTKRSGSTLLRPQ